MEQDRARKRVRNRRVVLDIFVILLLLVSVAGIVLRCFFYDRTFGTDRKQRASLTLEMVEVPATMPEYLRAGDAVYLEDGTLVGVLASDARELLAGDAETETETDTKTDSAESAQSGKDGEVGEVSIREDASGVSYRRICVGIEVLTEMGTLLQNSFRVNERTVLTIGDEVRLYTADAVFSAVVTEIAEVE